MATKIGQKNGYAFTNQESFGAEILTKLNIVANLQEMITVTLDEGSSYFSNNNNYYIEGTINKVGTERKIKVYLANQEGTSKYEIAILTISAKRNNNDNMEHFKIAFRPGKSSYSKLVFENITENSSEKNINLGFTAAWQLNNILSNEKVIQLGVQADPGFIFLINGEPIRVGRTGFFEAPEGYEITDISVTGVNFIMDYKYEVEEGV